MATACNSSLSRGVRLLPSNLCRFGRDFELLRGGLLRFVRSCSFLFGSRGQIRGRPHSLGCTQCFAGVYAEGPAPAAASASHRERSHSAASRCVPCFEVISSSRLSSAHSASVVRSQLLLACRMELSCAHQRRAYTPCLPVQALLAYTPCAPALMTTSLTPSRQQTPLLGAPAALLYLCVTAAQSWCLHTSKNQTKRTNPADF